MEDIYNMEHLITLSLIFLNLFMIVGAVDLFYFHIWKYKLHTRPESRYEHKLHMAFAFIMVPLAYFLYYQNSGGWALWAGVFFVAAALGTEMLDVFSEGDSRGIYRRPDYSGVFATRCGNNIEGRFVHLYIRGKTDRYLEFGVASDTGKLWMDGRDDGPSSYDREFYSWRSSSHFAEPKDRFSELPNCLRCCWV